MSRLVSRSLAFSAVFACLAGTALAAAPAVPADLRHESGMDDVAGAAVDLADAKAWLAELEGGNFAGIFAIGENGAMRCGEVAANPACAPLTDRDKAEAIAEARAAVGAALAAVEAAETDFAAGGNIQNVSLTP